METGQMTEADIQIQVVEYCRLLEKQAGFLMFSCPNEAMGGARGGAGIGRMTKLKKMGLRSGVADLVFVKNHQVYFLEMKAPKGIVSANQKAFADDAWQAGAFYAVAYSFEEAVNQLKLWRMFE